MHVEALTTQHRPADMTERSEMEVTEFAASLANCDDHKIVIALFDGSFSECVAILKCSEDAARALVKAIGFALKIGAP